MAGGSVLAEQVLHSVLDAQPVDISDIRAALVALQAKPQPEPRQSTARMLVLEKIARQVVLALEANAAWQQSFDDDKVDMDDCYVAWEKSFAALAPLLEELNHA
jgi:hypothetical protein